MVRPAAAGAHSSADAGQPAQGDRAGDGGAIHALAAALAARRARHQVLGERGTLEVLRQLQGFEGPASAWERQILAQRVADYDPEGARPAVPDGRRGLGPAFAASGHAGGCRRRAARGADQRRSHHLLRARRRRLDDSAPRRSDGELRGPEPAATQVLQYLRPRGASFFADIVRGTGKLKSEVETALWELVAAGLITADGFDNLRALIDPKRRAGQEAGAARVRGTAPGAGRCSMLAKRPTASRAIEATCWMLLRRYGVVFREVLARESMLPTLAGIAARVPAPGRPRRNARRALRQRLSRRTVCAAGGGGVAARDPQLPPANEMVTVSAADPLNLVGIIVPGERSRPIPATP